MATPIPQNLAVFSLSQITEACGGRLTASAGDQMVKGVAIDSRQVVPGNLFVAIVGENHDGHTFLEAAVQAGASCLLVREGSRTPSGVAVIEVRDTLQALGDLAKTHRNQFQGWVVTITGSVGKTTTKEFVRTALSVGGARVLSTPGNLNNLVGTPMTLLQLDAQFDLAVIEIGSSAPGEIARLAEITKPDVGMVTQVAVAHTEGLGSIKDIAHEKASLLMALSPEGVAIYNADNPFLCAWQKKLHASKQFRFGCSDDADVRLLSQKIDSDLKSHCKFEIKGIKSTLCLQLQILGAAAAVDAAAALAVVYAVQGPERLEAAAQAISELKPISGRLALRPGPKNSLLIDDTYNCNPESALSSLQTTLQLAQARGGRALVILGDMAELGEWSRHEHERVGREIIRLGAAVFIGCGNKMSDACDAAVIQAREIRTERSSKVIQVLDPLQAVGLAQSIIEHKDVVLIKGSRSMQMERVVDKLLDSSGEKM